MILSWLLALTFQEDAYSAAKKAAPDKPVVVDLWATWCHSCLSMQNYVLKDPSLDGLAKRASFVAVDTEKDVNASTVALLKPTAWPTFVIVDPKDDEVLARLIGSATAPAFASFVEEGIAAFNDKRAGKKSTARELAAADAALTSGNKDAAVKRYQELLANKDFTGPARARAASSLVYSLSGLGRLGECRSAAAPEALLAQGTYYEAILLASLFDCASEATPKATVTEAKVWAARLRSLIDDPKIAYNADDKSDLFATLSAMSEYVGDKTDAQALKLERLKVLEAASKSASSKEAARTFDAHRAELYVELGRADEAIAMLTVSEQQAPKDYNPPARLARAYLVKGQLPEATQAIERAKKLVYGPRSSVIWILEGDIATAARRPADAKSAYQRARDLLSKQAPTPGVTMRIKDLDRKLAAL